MILLLLTFSLATQASPAGDTSERVARPRAHAKVYTNQDLATAKGNVTAPGAPTTTPDEGAREATGGSGAMREPTEEEKRAQAREQIQASINDKRDLIAVRRMDIDRMQQEL